MFIMEKKIIVSLGRQYGSGGRELGRKVADELGIAYYDREIMQEVAKKSGMAVDYLESNDEQAPGFFDYATIGRFGLPHLFGSSQNFVMLSDAIKKIACKESCLIVGRTADYILREDPSLIKIFVHASRRYRILRVSRRLNVEPEEADSLITRYDKERARFYDFFTDKTWGQADSYDLCVDVSKLGMEDACRLVIDYIKMRYEKFK